VKQMCIDHFSCLKMMWVLLLDSDRHSNCLAVMAGVATIIFYTKIVLLFSPNRGG
jgi:hypothetical protein